MYILKSMVILFCIIRSRPNENAFKTRLTVYNGVSWYYVVHKKPDRGRECTNENERHSWLAVSYAYR